MQSVHVLVRVHAQQHLSFVDAFGQRQLDQEGVDLGIGVEPVNNCFNVSLRRRRWKVLAE